MPEHTAARLIMTSSPAGSLDRSTDTTLLATPIPTDPPAAFVAYLRAVPARDRARVVDLLAAQYRAQGHPDPLPLVMANDNYDRAMAEIGDEADTAEPVPTEPQPLYLYLRELDPAEQAGTADRLAMQLGGTPEAINRAADLVGRALSLIANEDMIDQLREHLAESLAVAIDAIRASTNAVDRLSSDDVFDVEYAEGGQPVWDLRGFLADAGRFVRAAAALNPCPPAKNDTAR